MTNGKNAETKCLTVKKYKKRFKSKMSCIRIKKKMKKTPLCQRQRKCRRRCRRRCRCCRRRCRWCRRRCRCCRRRCCRRYCNLSRVFIALRDLPFNLFQYFQTTSFQRPVQRNNLTLNKCNEANNNIP